MTVLFQAMEEMAIKRNVQRVAMNTGVRLSTVMKPAGYVTVKGTKSIEKYSFKNNGIEFK